MKAQVVTRPHAPNHTSHTCTHAHTPHTQHICTHAHTPHTQAHPRSDLTEKYLHQKSQRQLARSSFQKGVEQNHHEDHPRGPQLPGVRWPQHNVGHTRHKCRPTNDLPQVVGPVLALTRWANEQKVDHVAVQVSPRTMTKHVREQPPVAVTSGKVAGGRQP